MGSKSYDVHYGASLLPYRLFLSIKGIPLKKSVSDLALFGGQPTFDEFLHVGRPNLGSKTHFLERVEDILDRRWLTNDGPYLREFEQQVAKRLGVQHCIAVCNGTMGLQLAMVAAGLKGEVIVPSFTFVATVQALYWQGLEPVFCDVDPITHNIDPAQVEALITDRTSAIVGVHLWGQACEHDALQDIADRHGLTLLFDAAHAFLCSENGRMIGNFGDAEVLSFHATKFFNTLEGGAVVTNNSEMAQRLHRMRNFGFGGGSDDNIAGPGINAKMNEVSAAMGLTNFEHTDTFLQANFEHYHQYLEQLSGLPGIRMLQYPHPQANNCQYIVLEVDQHITGIHRNQIMQLLRAEQILARRYFYPSCHHIEPYATLAPDVDKRLSVTNRISEQVLVLPTGAVLTEAEITQVTGLMRFIIENTSKILSCWQHQDVKP